MPYSLDAPFTNVDLDDVGAVSALVLTEDGHAGVTYDLAGPERLCVREMATIAAAALGRPVEAVHVPLESWLVTAAAGLSAQQRADLAAMCRAYHRDGLVGDPMSLRRLLGRQPRTWAESLTRPPAGAS